MSNELVRKHYIKSYGQKECIELWKLLGYDMTLSFQKL